MVAAPENASCTGPSLCGQVVKLFVVVAHPLPKIMDTFLFMFLGFALPLKILNHNNVNPSPVV